jgi:hypothetical protein
MEIDVVEIIKITNLEDLEIKITDPIIIILDKEMDKFNKYKIMKIQFKLEKMKKKKTLINNHKFLRGYKFFIYK